MKIYFNPNSLTPEKVCHLKNCFTEWNPVKEMDGRKTCYFDGYLMDQLTEYKAVPRKGTMAKVCRTLGYSKYTTAKVPVLLDGKIFHVANGCILAHRAGKDDTIFDEGVELKADFMERFVGLAAEMAVTNYAFIIDGEFVEKIVKFLKLKKYRYNTPCLNINGEKVSMQTIEMLYELTGGGFIEVRKAYNSNNMLMVADEYELLVGPCSSTAPVIEQEEIEQELQFLLEQKQGDKVEPIEYVLRAFDLAAISVRRFVHGDRECHWHMHRETIVSFPKDLREKDYQETRLMPSGSVNSHFFHPGKDVIEYLESPFEYAFEMSVKELRALMEVSENKKKDFYMTDMEKVVELGREGYETSLVILKAVLKTARHFSSNNKTVKFGKLIPRNGHSGQFYTYHMLIGDTVQVLTISKKI